MRLYRCREAVALILTAGLLVLSPATASGENNQATASLAAAAAAATPPSGGARRVGDAGISTFIELDELAPLDEIRKQPPKQPSRYAEQMVSFGAAHASPGRRDGPKEEEEAAATGAAAAALAQQTFSEQQRQHLEGQEALVTAKTTRGLEHHHAAVALDDGTAGEREGGFGGRMTAGIAAGILAALAAAASTALTSAALEAFSRVSSSALSSSSDSSFLPPAEVEMEWDTVAARSSSGAKGGAARSRKKNQLDEVGGVGGGAAATGSGSKVDGAGGLRGSAAGGRVWSVDGGRAWGGDLDRREVTVEAVAGEGVEADVNRGLQVRGCVCVCFHLNVQNG